jgi:hypothetical protein
MRVAMLEEIGRHVAFDAYAWLITDPETKGDPIRWQTFHACRGCRG